MKISEGGDCANPVLRASLKPFYASRVLKRLQFLLIIFMNFAMFLFQLIIILLEIHSQI